MGHVNQFDAAAGITLGGSRPVFICGPCVVESDDLVLSTARRLQEIFKKLELPFVFKSSYDKANRTSGRSFRSLGFEKALQILGRVREELDVPVLTDVHEAGQVAPVSDVADILQVPAFLCRQTDLIQAIARSGKTVNIKKGQFMAPEDMQYAVEKASDAGNSRVVLTERGSSFGYHNLVVDMRSLVIMRRISPVIFDLTHSVQMPGGLGGKSGGQREFAPFLARAAAAVGVDGFFIETHPDPGQALSDGPNMVPLDEIEALARSLVAVWDAAQPFCGSSNGGNS
jgi:2-dehydro-3-deoxyphosphooctonate aldolase (KDO 8-P synthase)